MPASTVVGRRVKFSDTEDDATVGGEIEIAATVRHLGQVRLPRLAMSVPPRWNRSVAGWARARDHDGHRMARAAVDNGVDSIVLGGLLFVGSALYASVGQAGASAFVAAMGLVGLPAATMRPTALALNILAAGFSTWRFHVVRRIAWRALLPFGLASVPCSFLGGAIALPDPIYKPVVGVVLMIAAGLLFRRVMAGTAEVEAATRPPGPGVAAAIGGAIGLLSGLTATGGGVFLSPLLILLGWMTPRQAVGVAAPFILLNSIAGLAGSATLTPQVLPAAFPVYAAVTMAGTILGATIGIRYLPPNVIVLVLGLVLMVSGVKLVVF